MILSAIAAKLKQRARSDFKGQHYEAALIVQAVSWYLSYPLSYRDIEELFLERGLEVDHSTTVSHRPVDFVGPTLAGVGPLAFWA